MSYFLYSGLITWDAFCDTQGKFCARFLPVQQSFFRTTEGLRNSCLCHIHSPSAPRGQKWFFSRWVPRLCVTWRYNYSTIAWIRGGYPGPRQPSTDWRGRRSSALGNSIERSCVLGGDQMIQSDLFSENERLDCHKETVLQTFPKLHTFGQKLFIFALEFVAWWGRSEDLSLLHESFVLLLESLGYWAWFSLGNGKREESKCNHTRPFKV